MYSDAAAAKGVYRPKGRGALRRLTVEECLSLSVATFLEDGVFAAAEGSRWSLPFPGIQRIEFVVREAPGSALALFFDTPPFAFQCVRITTTKPHFGGLRHWFKCPFMRDGVSCSRRVGRLYLPPESGRFGCRHCHHLTYRSSQNHDARVDRLRRNAALLLGALKSNRASDNLLGLRAYAKNLSLLRQQGKMT